MDAAVPEQPLGVTQNQRGVSRSKDRYYWGIYLLPPHQCVTLNQNKDYIQHCGDRVEESRVPTVNTLVARGGDAVCR